MSTSQAPARMPVTTDVHQEVLEAQILSGQWPAGTRLPSERILAETLGVSRPVVREMLKKLQAEGLIFVLPGKGSYVADLAPSAGHATIDHLVRGGQITTRELIVARRMLEAEAAALAAVNRSAQDLDRMAALLEKFDQASSVQEAVELDTSFHESIVEAANNAVVQIMFTSIRKLVQGMVLRSLTDRRTRQMGAPIHHTILEAIEQQDPEAARREMLAHISLSEQRYGEDLDRSIADVLYQRAVASSQHADLLRELGDSIRNLR